MPPRQTRARGRGSRPIVPPPPYTDEGPDWSEPAPNGGVGHNSRANYIDPSKNVETLVRANAFFQDAMRNAESKYQDGMRDAETRRLDDMANLRTYYEDRISQVLTVQVKTTSELISTQLDKVTTALGQQITSSVNSLLERIGQLERFRWEVGGKTSVADPALSQALTVMANAIAQIQHRQDIDMGFTSGGRDHRSETRLTMGSIVGLISVALVAVSLIAGAVAYVAANHAAIQPQAVYPQSGSITNQQK